MEYPHHSELANHRVFAQTQLHTKLLDYVCTCYVFKASTGILFKSAESFSGCLSVLIHCLMPTFREHCSSFHQGEKQPDTISGQFIILNILNDKENMFSKISILIRLDLYDSSWNYE